MTHQLCLNYKQKKNNLTHSLQWHLSFVVFARAKKGCCFSLTNSTVSAFSEKHFISNFKNSFGPRIIKFEPFICFTTDWVTHNKSMQPVLFLKSSMMERVALLPHHLQWTGNSRFQNILFSKRVHWWGWCISLHKSLSHGALVSLHVLPSQPKQNEALV